MHQNQETNNQNIAASFETPEWYLKGYASNIRIRMETVSSIMGSRICRSILDIGCGDGSLSIPLLAKAERLVFLDQSSAMLSKVRSKIDNRFHSRVEYVNDGFMNASLDTQSFDLVICVGLLAYVQDIDSFLSRVARLLGKDGTLILECTDAGHTLSRLDRLYQFFTRFVRPRKFDIYQHSSKEVFFAARRAGFSLTRQFIYAYKIPLYSRFASASRNYKAIRDLFGDIESNKASFLGNQCILELRKI